MRSITTATFFLLSTVGSFVLAGPLRIADVDEIYPIIPHWSGAVVLHIGDSHVSAGLKAGLDASKREDGRFHLTRSQGEAWARQVWRWMNGETFNAF